MKKRFILSIGVHNSFPGAAKTGFIFTGDNNFTEIQTSDLFKEKVTATPSTIDVINKRMTKETFNSLINGTDLELSEKLALTNIPTSIYGQIRAISSTVASTGVNIKIDLSSGYIFEGNKQSKTFPQWLVFQLKHHCQ